MPKLVLPMAVSAQWCTVRRLVPCKSYKDYREINMDVLIQFCVQAFLLFLILVSELDLYMSQSTGTFDIKCHSRMALVKHTHTQLLPNKLMSNIPARPPLTNSRIKPSLIPHLPASKRPSRGSLAPFAHQFLSLCDPIRQAARAKLAVSHLALQYINPSHSLLSLSFFSFSTTLNSQLVARLLLAFRDCPATGGIILHFLISTPFI